MHEITIANKIIEEAKKQGASKSMKIEVGELCELTALEIEEALRKLIDWNLEVNFVKSLVKCSCGYEGSARIVERGHGFCYFNCPSCGGNPKVLKGGEINITGVE
ncbi:MAG: hydrogenase/urease maturation nickel metallochaperone HypA [Candidatus Woesearchaeota archaeon]